MLEALKSTALPYPLVAVTLATMYFPSAALVSLYFEAVAPLISVHPAERVDDQATGVVHAYQAYVYLMVFEPPNVPVLTLSEFPTFGLPERGGGEMLHGSLPTSAVVAVYAVIDAAAFTAVSLTRRYFPASDCTGV